MVPGPDTGSGSSGSSISGSSISGSAVSGDLFEDDAGEIADALPPIDVTMPQEADTRCPNPAATLIYVVTTAANLFSFNPPTGAFTKIGPIVCPTVLSSTANPFSMAVDRTGIAYVVYDDGELFRVSTATASCSATHFATGQAGFSVNFGMGFSRDSTGSGETLYVASGDGTVPMLGTIDTNTFQLKVIGNLNPPTPSAELTGTGGGDLFGFYSTSGTSACPNNGCPDTSIVQIDKNTGRATNQSVLHGLMIGDAWAFAFWGGDFYTFTHPSTAGSVVTRFDPATGALVTVSKLSEAIVGAGVSTCAPAR